MRSLLTNLHFYQWSATFSSLIFASIKIYCFCIFSLQFWLLENMPPLLAWAICTHQTCFNDKGNANLTPSFKLSIFLKNKITLIPINSSRCNISLRGSSYFLALIYMQYFANYKYYAYSVPKGFNSFSNTLHSISTNAYWFLCYLSNR